MNSIILTIKLLAKKLIKLILVPAGMTRNLSQKINNNAHNNSKE